MFLKLSAFFLWLKHCLSDLSLTEPLLSTVVLKDVGLNTLHTSQYRYLVLCVPMDFTTVVHGHTKKEWKRALDHPHCTYGSSLHCFCLPDTKVKLLDRNANLVSIIVSNPCYYQMGKATLSPLDWKGKIFPLWVSACYRNLFVCAGGCQRLLSCQRNKRFWDWQL